MRDAYFIAFIAVIAAVRFGDCCAPLNLAALHATLRNAPSGEFCGTGAQPTLGSASPL